MNPLIDGPLDWWDTGLRLVVAAVLGGALGLEREWDGQDAGFRTHMLLALGAGLFGAASVGAFHEFLTERAATNVNVDVTRIASYVAAGVGFIGGGAIIKHAGVVTGITTASSLWAAAAIGLSAGLGFWSGAVIATVVALIALAALRPVSTAIARRQLASSASMMISTSERADVAAILRTMREHGASVQTVNVSDPMPDGSEVQVLFWPPGVHDIEALVERLAALEGVRSVRTDRRRKD